MDNLFTDQIEGHFINLKKVTSSDALDIFTWRTSISGQYLRQPDPYTLESQIEWINSRNNDEANYIIYDRKSHVKVGMIGIYDLSKIDRVANVGRLLLKEVYLHQSNPYGLEALLLTYSHVFNQMGFRKISGVISAANSEMVKFQKFLGMTEEGYLLKHFVINNTEQDLYIMSLFKSEFVGYSNRIKFLLKSFPKNE